ncbi:MAG TPA: PIN domain-containing protein [Candidatus Cybelea sp.]|nr:PIN domain-containing protein [Candidatus Cybelea sp.]
MPRDRIVLDSGAVSALAEKGSSFRAALGEIFLKRGAQVLVPTAVIAESTTGDHRRDAHVNQALKRTSLIDLDARIARSAATLRHAHRRKGAGTIDAIVVATADLVPGSDVITADANDLNLLASVRGLSRVVTVSDVMRR